jgi:molybdate-binding protein/DNA-binding XRE family transcriptional regulator
MNQPVNRVREFRVNCGLTQAELAAQAGISRTAVTAIEGQRLIPAVSAALSLARALNTTVEQLFGNPEAPAAWAWESPTAKQPYWQAEVGGHNWFYPASSAPMLTPLPDGSATLEAGTTPDQGLHRQQTLVLACCDPAAGLLASEFARATGMRLLVLPRSSRESLLLLKQGKVHLAGLHFSTTVDPGLNASNVRELLGTDYQLLRIASWQEGIVTSSTSRVSTVRGAVKSRFDWVGREPGSGARNCLDRLLGERASPRHLARNHRGVAEAVQSGWADAGVCLQLPGIEAGLRFLPVETESYELCLPSSFLDEPRMQALLKTVQSVHYRKLLGDLPGYDVSETGTVTGVK